MRWSTTYLVGSERAFALRLMGQTALCQLQIERNTRSTAAARWTQPAQACADRTSQAAAVRQGRPRLKWIYVATSEATVFAAWRGERSWRRHVKSRSLGSRNLRRSSVAMFGVRGDPRNRARAGLRVKRRPQLAPRVPTRDRAWVGRSVFV